MLPKVVTKNWVENAVPKIFTDYLKEADENPATTIMSVAELIRKDADSGDKIAKTSIPYFLMQLRNAGLPISYAGLKAYYNAHPELANVIQTFNDEEIVFVGQGDEEDSESLGKPQGDIPPAEVVDKMAKRAMKARASEDINESSNHEIIMGFVDQWTEAGQPDDYMDDLVAYVKKTIPDSKNWNYAASLIQDAVKSYQEREYGASSLMGLRKTSEDKIKEGWYNTRAIDKERYTDLSAEGLEGPFMTKSGKVLYYDPKEGKYYDRDSDMYLDYEEYKAYDEPSIDEQDKGYTDADRGSMRDLINRLEIDAKMDADPYGADYTPNPKNDPGFGLEPEDTPLKDPGFGLAPKSKPKYTPKAPDYTANPKNDPNFQSALDQSDEETKRQLRAQGINVYEGIVSEDNEYGFQRWEDEPKGYEQEESGVEEPGTYLYSGFGSGTYYSVSGEKVWVSPQEASAMAEKEGVQFRYVDALDKRTMVAVKDSKTNESSQNIKEPARQYKGDGTDEMVEKDGKVIVIDKEDLDRYLEDGWQLAESIAEEKFDYWQSPSSLAKLAGIKERKKSKKPDLDDFGPDGPFGKTNKDPLDQGNKGYIDDPEGHGQGNIRPDGSTRPGYKPPKPKKDPFLVQPEKPKVKGYDI
jgi:hypothetical protein